MTLFPYTTLFRSRFLWQLAGPSRKKYALLKWSKACLAKENGGLGILNLQEMNISLLLKWWWKFHNNEYSALWKTVIQHNYYSADNIPFSPFWITICKLNSLGHMSVAYTPGIASELEFWHTIWHDNCALSTRFPQLYAICSNKHILLTSVILSQGTSIRFSRCLSGILVEEWQQILYLLSTSSFTHHYDKIAWRWETSGQFTCRSIYKLLNFRGVNDNKYVIIWSLPIPPKIRIFEIGRAHV